ncbi:hypothetical protein [Saccharopolyspora sp. 5N708]|uniref:hypothetical protein n=1 Tax=Saccharopolyspora sp. 5N708 TaxID=3457424 RepID=UPI003FD461CC
MPTRSGVDSTGVKSARRTIELLETFAGHRSCTAELLVRTTAELGQRLRRAGIR